MQKRLALAAYRLSVGVLALGGVVVQTVNGFFHPPFDYPNYFSFFSIQSSLFAALVLIASAIRIGRGEHGEGLTFWRGAVTLCLTLAGTVYLVLLGGASESLQSPREQTNAVLHYLVPVALLADWFLGPKERIPFRLGLMWLLYPLLYVVYSLVRGRFTEWYPYPFLNPIVSGYPGIVTVCLIMAAAMIGFIALLTKSTTHDRRA
ncbi:MAG: Pr6Pr family membrane protein [Akkermansiaceae bacterium]|nr:Pr6Pr family membrane protein [Armatimonadota bacterium]